MRGARTAGFAATVATVVLIICVQVSVDDVAFPSTRHLVQQLSATPQPLECHMQHDMDVGVGVVPLASQAPPGFDLRTAGPVDCCKACLAHVGIPHRCNLWAWVAGACWLKYAAERPEAAPLSASPGTTAGGLWGAYSPPKRLHVITRPGQPGELSVLRVSALRAGVSQLSVAPDATPAGALKVLEGSTATHVLLTDATTLFLRQPHEAPPRGTVLGLWPMMLTMEDARYLLPVWADAHRADAATGLFVALNFTRLHIITPPAPYNPLCARASSDKLLGSAFMVSYKNLSWLPPMPTVPRLRAPQQSTTLVNLFVLAFNSAGRRAE